jgi:hypothetical protein
MTADFNDEYIELPGKMMDWERPDLTGYARGDCLHLEDPRVTARGLRAKP